jgi:hypothetical protein
MQMRKKLYIFKQFAKSKKLFFANIYLSPFDSHKFETLKPPTVYTSEACAASGCVYSTEASTAHRRVYTIKACAAPGRVYTTEAGAAP